MLVSVQTQFRRRIVLAASHVDSATVIHAATIGPQIDKLLEPAHVVNAQAFGAPQIATMPPGQLSPAHVVNASVVHPKTIQAVVAPPVTDYANPKGSGDRRATIVATDSGALFASGNIQLIINGSFSPEAWFGAGAVGQWMKFDFGTPRLFDAFKWSQSNANGQGVWKWQASADDSSYVDLGSPFTLEGNPGGAPWEIAQPSGNVTKYRFWKMQQVSGGTTAGPYVVEIEFKIDPGP